MGTAFVVVLTAIAPLLGPVSSGLVATFPVYVSVLAVFEHVNGGRSAALGVLRGLLVGLFGTVAFYCAIRWLVVPAGIAVAFSAAIVATAVIGAVALNRVRAGIGTARPSPSRPRPQDPGPRGGNLVPRRPSCPAATGQGTMTPGPGRTLRPPRPRRRHGASGPRHTAAPPDPGVRTMALDLGARAVRSLLPHAPRLPADEIDFLLQLAARLKREKSEHRETRRLAGRSIALIFEKDSTRTRIGFEVAAYDQGAHVTYLGPTGSHIGKKESVKDTARVLGRVYDAIEFRGFHQADVEALAHHSGVPVYNGLTDEDHPTQVLADLLTIREHVARPLGEVALAYVGDARGNMGDELLIGASTMGMDLRIVAPEAVWPRPDFLAIAQDLAAGSGARITVTDDIADGVRGADVVYTDVWVSMGEPETTWDERIALLRPYQVDAALMAMTGNPDVKFMHCLPAFHDLETDMGRKMYERHGLTAMEVTDDVFESEGSIVFDQAENRMHTIKAVLVATLSRDGGG